MNFVKLLAVILFYTIPEGNLMEEEKTKEVVVNVDINDPTVKLESLHGVTPDKAHSFEAPRQSAFQRPAPNFSTPITPGTYKVTLRVESDQGIGWKDCSIDGLEIKKETSKITFKVKWDENRRISKVEEDENVRSNQKPSRLDYAPQVQCHAEIE